MTKNPVMPLTSQHEDFAVLCPPGMGNHSLPTADFVTHLLRRQSELPAAMQFSQWHEEHVRNHDNKPSPTHVVSRYSKLLPQSSPSPGEQYAFEVNLDQCSGCKACVAACHTLNGLDDNESWRRVGMLHDTQTAFLQHVTSACHHCIEPACLIGCPVKAYEKDASTGIVKHLDDQCIGCNYCSMTCPYEVPRYNARLGIVRKCDMCSQRLKIGEAPACVQACPNEAIQIVLVNQQHLGETRAVQDAGLVPGATANHVTLPTTIYRSRQAISRDCTENALADDRLQPAHLPLAIMLVLTQASIGLLIVLGVSSLAANSISPNTNRLNREQLWLVSVLFLAGSGIGSLHLGQPLRAWKVFLGVRTSWLSREAVCFGLFMLGLFLCLWLESFPKAPWNSLVYVGTSLLGIVAIYCSAMVYVATKRSVWRRSRTHALFLLTATTTGSMGAVAYYSFLDASLLNRVCIAAFITAAVKLVMELLQVYCARPNSFDERSARLRRFQCVRANRIRLICGSLSLITCSAIPWCTMPLAAALGLLGALCWIAGECIERTLYFRTVAFPHMPGTASGIPA